MTAQEFDKFVWARMIRADSRFAPIERLVLYSVAVESVRYDGDTFCVRQATLAERCATTKKSVGAAIRKAKEFGYLIVVIERTHGRGHTKADVHRLAMPVLGNHPTPINPEIENQPTPFPDQKKVTIGTEIGNQAEPSTSANDRAKGTLEGLLEGLVEGTAPVDDEPRCEEHLDPIEFPTPPSCPGCQRVRKTAEAEAAAAAHAAAAERQAIRTAIDKCRDCDTYGRLDDQSDCPLHRNFRQLRTGATA